MISIQKTHVLHNTSVHDILLPSFLCLLHTGASPPPQQEAQGGVPVTIETEGFSSVWWQRMYKPISSILIQHALPLLLLSPPSVSLQEAEALLKKAQQ